jgi:hypothetical protein
LECVFVPIVAIVTSTCLNAQQETRQHHQYKLVDLGTFGRPRSIQLVLKLQF